MFPGEQERLASVLQNTLDGQERKYNLQIDREVKDLLNDPQTADDVIMETIDGHQEKGLSKEKANAYRVAVQEREQKRVDNIQADEFNRLQVDILDGKHTPDADGHSSPATTLADIERRSRLDETDTEYINPQRRIYATSMLQAGVKFNDKTIAVYKRMAGEGGSLTSDHDNAIMSVLHSEKMIDEAGIPTNPEKLAATLQKFGRVPNDMKQWLDANAASDDVKDLIPAIMLSHTLHRNASDTLAESGSLSKTSTARMDMAVNELNKNSPPINNKCVISACPTTKFLTKKTA